VREDLGVDLGDESVVWVRGLVEWLEAVKLDRGRVGDREANGPRRSKLIPEPL
jgi:hypothetical protein